MSAVDAVAAAFSDPAEHLGVEMDELAWSLAFVTDDRSARLQAIESAQASSPKEGINGRSRETRLPAEDVRTDPLLAPASANTFGDLGWMRPRLAVDDAPVIE